MIKALITDNPIFNRRTLTEVFLILLALIITFYAGYTLGQYNYLDDNTTTVKSEKTNIVQPSKSKSLPFVVN